MPQEMSIRIPPERGEQLREFARLQSLGISEAIALLLDHAVTTGLVRELPMPDIEVKSSSDGVCLQVGGIRVYLSVAQANSLADSLHKVARTPGAVVLDMDGPYIIELRRQGRGVVLMIAENGEKRKAAYGKHGLFSRTFACDVARALARQIEAAAIGAAAATAAQAQHVTVADGPASGVDHETVEALLGDLEISNDDGVTETVLDESDVSALEVEMKDA